MAADRINNQQSVSLWDMFRLSFSGGHICWSPYTVATRLLASAGPVVGASPDVNR